MVADSGTTAKVLPIQHAAVSACLMCPPESYRTSFLFNPWLDYRNDEVVPARAQAQWGILESTLSDHGVEVSPIRARAARARFNVRDGARAGIRTTYFRSSSWDGVRASGGSLWGSYGNEASALKTRHSVFPDLEQVKFVKEKPPVIEKSK